MMHAGSLSQEFDTVYTQKGHGRTLREQNTKLTDKDILANLEVHERIVFCHILDMRENMAGQKRKKAENEVSSDSNQDSA